MELDKYLHLPTDVYLCLSFLGIFWSYYLIFQLYGAKINTKIKEWFKETS